MEQIKDYQRTTIDDLNKDIYRVYPYKIKILRKVKIYSDYEASFKDKTLSDGSVIKATKTGYYREKNYNNLYLWTGTKPSIWEQVMNQVTAPLPPI